MHKADRSRSAKEQESKLYWKYRSRGHARPSPERIAKRRLVEQIDRRSLRDRNDRHRSGQEMESVVCEPDAEAERHEGIRVLNGRSANGWLRIPSPGSRIPTGPSAGEPPRHRRCGKEEE